MNSVYEILAVLKFRSLARNPLNQESEIRNGCGSELFAKFGARALKLAPFGRPYQRNSPSGVRGPCQILSITSAACCENVQFAAPEQVKSEPTRRCAVKSQRAGAEMIPSREPSKPSQAAIAAVTAAWNSLGEGAYPSLFCTVYGHC